MIINSLFLVGIIYSMGSAYFDLKTRKIPNKYNLLAFCLILLSKAILGVMFSWTWLIDGLLGMLAGFAILFPFFAFRKAGAGDVKMLSILGLLLGWKLFLLAFAIISCCDMFIITINYLKIAWKIILEPTPLIIKKESIFAYLKDYKDQKNPYAFPVAIGCLILWAIYMFNTDVSNWTQWLGRGI